MSLLLLPALVQDLIDWYKWKDGFTWVNKEYRRGISEDISKLGRLYYVWFNCRHISRLDKVYNYRIIGRWQVDNSILERRGPCLYYSQLPEKYHYSSGLNDLTGYTNNEWKKFELFKSRHNNIYGNY